MSKLSGINLNRLSIFAAVIEAGSLTGAAERLGIAKTMVSTHLQRLEAEVGASLLIRTTRRLHVTEAGQAFYESVRHILNATETAVNALSNDTEGLRGNLRIATPIDYGIDVIAPVLVQLRQRHPALTIELLSHDSVVDLVAEGIDVAIRLGRLADSTHRAIRLGGFVKWLVAAPAFIETHGIPATPETASQMDYIAMAALQKPLMVSLENAEGEKRHLRFAAGFIADTAPACRAAALAGGGIAWLTDFTIGDDIAAGRLVRLLPEWASPAFGIHAVFPSTRFTAPKVRAFVDALKAHLQT